MSLRELIAKRAPIADVASYLDGLAPDVRMLEANSLPRRDQAQLFDMAADSPPIRVSHFVPDDVPAQKAVHHPGRNTVPVPTYFKHFQKRFMKSARPEHQGLLGGYNASNAFFIHPGYFVGYETDGKHLPPEKQSMQKEWFARGPVVIDYFQVPEGWALPEGWPRVVPNSVGLQRFVYDRTRDFMRGVSRHVSIGRAATEDRKGDRNLDFWFTLVREERMHLAMKPG
ncbi:MAG: hypothetical protein U0353_27695 [Sandaracinus sp.]